MAQLTNENDMITNDIQLKRGDLFYWHKKVLCEYIGRAKDGRYMFQTTNGGVLYIFPDKIGIDIDDGKE